MFEFFLRKTVFKTLSKEDQDIVMLKKDKFKLEFLAIFLNCLFVTLPLVTLFVLMLFSELTVSNIISSIILIVSYSIFAIYFIKRFHKPIEIFNVLIAMSMYASRYILKGNAILKDDFEIIKKEQEEIYEAIMSQQVKGFCYSVCFEILNCLKKGAIQFIAIRSKKDDMSQDHNEYVMHVLYVNNNWCFDTFSGRQYPVEEVLKSFKAKIYKSFAYADIEGKSYEEFKEEHVLEIEEWCRENNCSTFSKN